MSVNQGTMLSKSIEILSFFNQDEFLPPPAGRSVLWFSLIKQLQDLGYLEYLKEDFDDKSFIYFARITYLGRKHLLSLKRNQQKSMV